MDKLTETISTWITMHILGQGNAYMSGSLDGKYVLVCYYGDGSKCRFGAKIENDEFVEYAYEVNQNPSEWMYLQDGMFDFDDAAEDIAHEIYNCEKSEVLRVKEYDQYDR